MIKLRFTPKASSMQHGDSIKKTQSNVKRQFLFLESSCECSNDGTVDCSDRCVAPLQPSGRASGDPLCIEQVNIIDFSLLPYLVLVLRTLGVEATSLYHDMSPRDLSPNLTNHLSSIRDHFSSI